jgi:amino acid transporter
MNFPVPFETNHSWLPQFVLIPIAILALLFMLYYAFLSIMMASAVFRGRHSFKFSERKAFGKALTVLVTAAFVLACPLAIGVIYLGASALIVGPVNIAALGAVVLGCFFYFHREWHRHTRSQMAKVKARAAKSATQGPADPES